MADLQTKLVQDLTIWMLEQYGIGFSTPNFGSNLQAMIGQSSPQILASQVQAEVTRILGLYRTQQQQQLTQAQSTNQLANWSLSQVIQSINSVVATAAATQVTVVVNLTTLAGSNTTLQVSVTSSGVSVS